MNIPPKKKKFMLPHLTNSSGVILVVVLWVLVILIILTIGLGRQTTIELSLSRYTLAKLKAKYIAWGGLIYALNQIKKDTKDPETGQFDSLYQCGIKLEKDSSPEILFQRIPLGDGYFRISYFYPGESLELYGMIDEERKINLNSLTAQNYLVFKNLLMKFGVDDRTAETIAASVVDWKDADSQPTHPPDGAEDDFYQNLKIPYHCKNSAFDTIEELMLVKGMTPEIFGKIKDFITIFPKESTTLLININTASAPVIESLAEIFTGGITNTEASDAKSLTDKILAYRAGSDGQIMTNDDQLIGQSNTGLNPKETAIFLSMQNNITKSSHYFRVIVDGIEENSKTVYRINAVVYRDNLSIVSWRRD